MRKGYQLENQFKRWFKFLNDNGVFAIKLQPERTDSGIRVNGEPFDAIIISKGKTYCFDLKESQSEKFSLLNAKLHQVKYLKICQDNGAESFFLVYFYTSKILIRFDIDVIINALTLKQKTLTADKGIPFDYVSYQ